MYFSFLLFNRIFPIIFVKFISIYNSILFRISIDLIMEEECMRDKKDSFKAKEKYKLRVKLPSTTSIPRLIGYAFSIIIILYPYSFSLKAKPTI